MDKLPYSSSTTRSSSSNNHNSSSSGYNWDHGMGMPMISMDDHHQILHIDPYHHHQNPFPFNNSSSFVWPAGYPLPSGPSLSSSSSVTLPYKTHPITGSNTTCSTFLFSTTTSPPQQQQQLQEAAAQSQPQEILLGSTGRDHDGGKLQRNKELEGDKEYYQTEQLADKEGHDQDEDQDDQDDEELGAMKEMMYKIAAMQPVDIDPASVRKPKRRNVRISDDPQSVAARLRRERISEKIRILQRLVPGGTKLDTASMLEEAVRYVKFLKRQIRLLQPPSTTAGHEHRHQQQQLADQIQPPQPQPPPPPHQLGGFVGPFISDPSSQLMSLDGRRFDEMQDEANSGIRGNPTSTTAATTTTSTTSANVDEGRLSFDP